MFQRGGQLTDPVAAELVGVLDAQLRPAVPDDLALLAEGAGHHGDLGAGRRVPGDCDAVVDRLVVGVGVDEDQPRTAAMRSNPTDQKILPIRRPRSGFRTG